MSNHLTPIEVCERMIGPIEDLSRICGKDAKAGYLWRRGSQHRDAGDLPSTRHQRSLMAHAAKNGLPLEPDWLIFGAPERDVDKAMADFRRRDDAYAARHNANEVAAQ